MKNPIFKHIIVLLTILCATNISYARFATEEDADMEVEIYNVDYNINKNGTYTVTHEEQIKLVKEQSRSIAAKCRLHYNGNAQKLEILEAKTIFEDKEYKVDQTMIEDKPVSNDLMGFDSMHQVSMSFPKPEVGAKIYFKYRVHNHGIPIQGHFASIEEIGEHGYLKKANINISSEIPLKMKIIDPFNVLHSKSETSKCDKCDETYNAFKSHIELKKPFTNETIAEPSQSQLNPDKKTTIYFSSFDSWEQMGNELAKDYDPILKQQLPSIFKEIADTASKEEGSMNQINKVTTLLNEKIQYLGDWRTIKGRLIANNLDIIARRQSGDCKDFATITAAILNHMGYKTNVALVYRGEEDIINLDLMLPTISAYNHLILRAIDKNGDVYWIDPTNIVSMADGIFPDIANKPSLVLKQDNSSLSKVPQIKEDHSKRNINYSIEHKDNITNEKINVTLYGEGALMLTGYGLYASKRSIEDTLYSVLKTDIEYGNRTGHKIPDLTSRVVSPISFELNYSKKNMAYKTNLGYAYPIQGSYSIVNKITAIDPNTDVHDIYLAFPSTIEYRNIFKGNNVKNIERFSSEIQTPWISIKRKAYLKNKDSIVACTFRIHTPWISNDEIKSDEFKKLKDFIERDIKNSLIVIGS